MNRTVVQDPALLPQIDLSVHPAVLLAGLAALRDFGLSTGPSSLLEGNTLCWELENALAETLRTEHVVLFPSAWTACFATITGLIGTGDCVVVDRLAEPHLAEAARAATAACFLFDDLQALDERLRTLRALDTENTILVVSQDPYFTALQEVCQRHGAALLLDVSHGFTAGFQGNLERVELVLGSFSETFSSPGGFLATHEPAVKQRLESLEESGLSPVQAAVLLQKLRILLGEE
jgi:7-keto-8-aminopelargonate synthetase-like enzyme